VQTLGTLLSGAFSFEAREWEVVTEAAKDMITLMLVCWGRSFRVFQGFFVGLKSSLKKPRCVGIGLGRFKSFKFRNLFFSRSVQVCSTGAAAAGSRLCGRWGVEVSFFFFFPQRQMATCACPQVMDSSKRASAKLLLQHRWFQVRRRFCSFFFQRVLGFSF
jgi:hypothetical protein